MPVPTRPSTVDVITRNFPAMADRDISVEDIQFWKEFFQLYKETPCLWDVEHRDYLRIPQKTLAHNLLLEKYWEYDGSATLNDMKKRINAFRSGVRREYKKVQTAKITGKKYSPKVWYYQYLKYLKESHGDDEETGSVLMSGDKSNDSSETKRATAPKITNVTSLAQPSTSVEKIDDCSSFAEFIQDKMRSFDPEQKSIAQKLISDVMFMASTKQLQLGTVVLNPQVAVQPFIMAHVKPQPMAPSEGILQPGLQITQGLPVNNVKKTSESLNTYIEDSDEESPLSKRKK